jgi:hypothetical protein
MDMIEKWDKVFWKQITFKQYLMLLFNVNLTVQCQIHYRLVT